MDGNVDVFEISKFRYKILFVGVLSVKGDKLQ